MLRYMARFDAAVNAMLWPDFVGDSPPPRPRIDRRRRFTEARHIRRETGMLQIGEHNPGVNGQDLTQVVKALRVVISFTLGGVPR